MTVHPVIFFFFKELSDCSRVVTAARNKTHERWDDVMPPVNLDDCRFLPADYVGHVCWCRGICHDNQQSNVAWCFSQTKCGEQYKVNIRFIYSNFRTKIICLKESCFNA